MRSMLFALPFYLVAAVSTYADTIRAEYAANGRGRSDIHTTYGSQPQDWWVGQLVMELTDGTGAAAALNGERPTFCVDALSGGLPNGSNQLDVVGVGSVPDPAMGAIRAAAIHDIHAFTNLAQNAPDASNSLCAAFQLAIWEIEYDYDGTFASLDVTSGFFEAEMQNGDPLVPAVQTRLNELFNATQAVGSSSDGIFGLKSSADQDQIVSIPEPTAMALLALAIVGLLRRR